MTYKYTQTQSLLDYLIDKVPGLNIQFKAKQMVDPLAARTLFAIWRDEKNEINANLYRRPPQIASHQVEAMEKAGLVKSIGDKVEITDKGANVIKVMVLGDDSSIFDKNDDRIIDYATAVQNTKNASANNKRHSLSKTASGNWWSRFES